MGYHRAGFDVVGVDIRPQPRYPFEFHQGDALMALTAMRHGEFGPIAAIHASPPCQEHIRGGCQRNNGTGWLLEATRNSLMVAAMPPWVIENVPGAPMRADYVLCGCMFGLFTPGLGQLVRQRWFETSWRGFDWSSPCYHRGPAITIVGQGTPSGTLRRVGRGIRNDERRAIMGIDWMTGKELSQAPI